MYIFIAPCNANCTFLKTSPLRYNGVAKEVLHYDITNIGVWGRRHYNYLKKNSPTVINVMRMKGTLEQYIIDVDRDAQEMYDRLVKQYVEIEGVTESLKATDNLEWTRRMNSIRNRVEKFILHDLIFN
ncbi:MAG: TnpV protein [Clostridiales bacterium]|nr:TnpV protein [Clostridiales bacterium]